MKNFFCRVAKFFTFKDLAVIFIVCVFSIGSAFFVFGKGEAENIVIELDGKVYAVYNMRQLGKTPREISINSKYGRNVLAIDRTGADMVYSDCPQQIDVKHRKIRIPGETIVCAPHKLVVYITGESEFDAVTG